jgi:sec-independent protein translocase protein TatB
MFGLSAWHVAILVVVGLFVFGPERLPTLLRDFGKALRQVRHAANSMQEDLKAELGPEVGDLDLRSLHPRTFVEKHLFGDEEDPLGLDFLRKEMGKDADPVISFDKPDTPALDKTSLAKPNGSNGSHASAGVPPTAPEPAHEVRFDADAT